MVQSTPKQFTLSIFFGLLCLISMACNPLHTKQTTIDTQLHGEQQRWLGQSGQATTANKWWTVFGDSQLNSVIEKLHRQNLDLDQAWQRLAQAKAAQHRAAGGQLPTLDASLSVGGSRGHDFQGNAQTNAQYGISLAAGYEIDLWEKLGARNRAALLDFQASRFDLDSLATSLTAQCVDLWFTLIELRATQALIEQQVATNQTQLALIRLRYENGLTPATAVLQQEAQVHATNSLLPPILGRLEKSAHALAILLGKPPAQGRELAGESTQLPAQPALPTLGVPAQLLSKRPDIRALQNRVMASDERLGAALADKLPSFRLQVSAGVGASSFSELLDRWIWSLTGSLLAPIFDGGQRSAEVERSRAVLAEQLSGYKAAYFRALLEVEDALSSERREFERMEHIRTELSVARKLLDRSLERYIQGLSDYLPVLTALQSVQRIDRNLLTARRALLSHRVALYRALGGTWARSLRHHAATDG
jgi:NodT family efflux transporter outer membrane factor (OMF) lipoprotein